MHLILDVQAEHGLGDGAVVASFILNLVSLLPGVHIRFGPHIEKFGNGSSYGPGITAIAIISESHIVVHTAPERNLLQVDVFSCQEFNISQVEALVQDIFQVTKVLLKQVIDR